MINLIPAQAKRKLQKEYWFRVVSVWMLIWSTALIVGAFILLPVYVLIGSQISVYEDSAIEASQRVTNYENVSGALVQASQQARFIIDQSSVPVFSEYLTIFETLEGEDIEIKEFLLEVGKDGIAPINISGVASGRQTLATFRDDLLALDIVKEVDFPISNLAKDKDIPFNISVVLNNEKDI